MAVGFFHFGRMLPGSLGSRVGLAIIGLIASAAIPSYGIHRLLSAEQDDRAHAEMAGLLGVALTADAANFVDTGAPAATHDANANATQVIDDRRTLQEVGRRVEWVGAFRGPQRCAEIRRTGPLRIAEIADQIDFARLTPERKALRINGVAVSGSTLMTLPLPEKQMTLAAIFSGESPISPAAAMRIGALLAGGFVGVFLSGLWLRCMVLGPVARINRTLGGLEGQLAAGPNDPTLPSELRELGRMAGQCRDEIHRWRHEATHLRYSVESRVDAKTRAAQRAREQAEREAETDALTGLANRRALDQDLPELFDAHAARGQDLAVLVIDVDHFKEFNDRMGHSGGDELLAFLGELIRGCVRRDQDRAFRHGGDEFVLALPRTPASDAAATARRLAALFGQRVRTMTTTAPLPALSIGIAGLRENSPGTWNELLELADQAMYAAKRSRTGVCCYQDLAQFATIAEVSR